MKSSRYNILFEHKGEKFAFNSFTAALNKVDNNFVHILNDIDKISQEEKDTHKDLLQQMKRGGYLIDENFDELKALEFYNVSKKFNGDTLALTIALTMSCNFACPYCYENSKKGTISSAMQDKLFEFVEKNLNGKEYLKITWFGGEPLCAKEIMYSLSSRFIELCERMSVKYSAKMISNFYLADEETISNLKKYKVGQVQVTIDGPEKVHNSRRKLKSGSKPTFDTIINNIVKAKKIGLPIIIRINADKTNIDSLEELADVLIQNDLSDTQTYLGHTVAFCQDCPSELTNDCLEPHEFSLKIVEFTKMLLRKGFNKKVINTLYPRVLPFHCSAHSLNSFVVGPEGELYKCEHEVGKNEKIIGYISNYCDGKSPTSAQTMHNFHWLLSSPFKEKVCKECNLLPICMGGCLDFKNSLQKPYCMPWKYNIAEALKIKCDNL